jgi:hypothetical protein
VVLYAIESGCVRVRTRGNSKSENLCPVPPDPWYFKDSLALAPCGVPDFDQYQMPGPAFCGPTAEANSYWWLNAKYNFDTIPGSPSIPALISEIAAVAGTNPVAGTNCDQLEAAILQVIKTHGGWWFTEETKYKPDFWYLQKELKKCHDITLLLGFWQFDGANWYRFGGHFVTMAGVDIFSTPVRFALSDPALDKAEAMFPNPLFGVVCHTDPFPHVGNPLVHNNPANTSHDFYDVAWPSPEPTCGYVYLPLYEVNWPDFNGQNAGPCPNTGTYNPAFPVTVEVEQAINVWPGSKEQEAPVKSSEVWEWENNHGGITQFIDPYTAPHAPDSGLYYGTIIAGTEQADLNADYGDYYPTATFNAVLPIIVDSFVVSGSAGSYTIQQLSTMYSHTFIPGLNVFKYSFGFWVPEGGTADCEKVIEDVYVFQNTGASSILGLETAWWLDYDVTTGGAADLAGFDQQHQSIWEYDPSEPARLFGMTKKPMVAGDVAVTGYGISQATRVYDKQYVDSLKWYMENLGWGVDLPTTPEDKSILIADGAFDLQPGEMRLEKWLKWRYADTIAVDTTGKIVATDATSKAWMKFLFNVLHQEGFYRGDVDKNGKLDIADVIYMINYLFKGGPKPIEFVDQGDVNNDTQTNVADVIYIINRLFKGGPAPIDKNRFLSASPFINAATKALAVRNPGLFGVNDWKDLGK